MVNAAIAVGRPTRSAGQERRVGVRAAVGVAGRRGPVHRGVHLPQRVRAGHRPVAAEAQLRAGARPGCRTGTATPSAPGPRNGSGQLGHLRLVARPQRLAVRRHAERHGTWAGRRGGRPGGARCDAVPSPGPVRGPGGGDRVERLADRAVPDGVDVDLEPAGVDGGHRLRSVPPGSKKLVPRAPGRVAVAIEVGGQHRGREVLADAVLHDLHAGGAEPALASQPPAVRQENRVAQDRPSAATRGHR